MLKFRGSQQFRQRLAFSTISGKPIRIDGIREQDRNPGLRDYEVNLLRLLEKITNGCTLMINETGTSIRYKPGFIVGGTLAAPHDCGTSRGIGYFLEPLLLCGLFAKKALALTLRGCTCHASDPGVDVWRSVTLPLLKQLGLEGALELRVASRGAAPGGGGEVHLQLPMAKALPAVRLTDEGLVKRIRGVAYSMKVSPQNTNRMVDGARGVLNQLLADVYVFTDATSGVKSGKSPGFGLALVAETTSGVLLSSETCAEHRPANADSRSSQPGSSSGGDPKTGSANDAASLDLRVPEDVGKHAALSLLEEIGRGGVVDGLHQGLLLSLCAVGPAEIQEVRLGPLTPYAIRTLRHLADFFGTKFSVRPERASRTIFMSCVGAGITNMSRKVT